MRRLRALWVRLADVVRPGRRDRDFDEELASHLQLHIDDNLAVGMPPDEARRVAIVRLGGIAQTHERYRDRARLPFVDAVAQDILYAFRTFRKNRGFALTAMLTLALGIGSTSAIFSAINAVLLRPLPFADSDRLVMVYGVARSARGVDMHDSVSYPNFADWRDLAATLEGAGAYANRPLTVTTAAGESRVIRGKQVTPSLFGVLGVRPALGRAFRPDEDQPALSRVVILSDGFWRQRLGGDPQVLGRTLQINDTPFTIVGVMAPDFHIDVAEMEQLYAPLPVDATRNHEFLRVIARLRSDASARQAQADLDEVCRRLAQLYPRTNEGVGANVEPLVDAIAGPGRLALLILFAVVTVVLLIACTNVASLLLARGATRQREMAVRAALGAGRGRLIRQLLVESLLLALAGGIAGLFVADWLARGLVAMVSDVAPVPRLDATRTDMWVVAFTTSVSLITGIVFGIAPALVSASTGLNEALRDAGRSSTGGRAPRIRRGLVVLETALALVLLAGAGALTKTLLTMRATPPGFSAENLLVVNLYMPPTRLSGLESRVPFFDATLARIRGLPGVRDAAFVADLPLSGASDSESFHIPGRPDPAPNRWFNAGFNIASSHYFRTMGIRIGEGRDFQDSDTTGAPGVIVINQTAAKRFWPDRSAIGQQIDLPVTRQKTVRLTVVGVADDVRHLGLAVPPRPEVFVNSLQSELTWPSVVLAVRTANHPSGLADAVKGAVHETGTGAVLVRIDTLDAVIARSMAQPRLYTSLLGAFAVAAVVLAAVGLYGLISFSVAQRAHEMGIRVALGASRSEIVRLVLGEGVGLAVAGTAIGVAGGLAVTRALVGLMAGIQPNDPLTFAVVATMLLVCACLASYVPARRAAAADPLMALRAE